MRLVPFPTHLMSMQWPRRTLTALSEGTQFNIFRLEAFRLVAEEQSSRHSAHQGKGWQSADE